MTAFQQWFKREYERDPDAAISYLFRCTLAEPNSVVWDYLKRTGDTQYTRQTFEKVAKLILYED